MSKKCLLLLTTTKENEEKEERRIYFCRLSNYPFNVRLWRNNAVADEEDVRKVIMMLTPKVCTFWFSH